MPPLPAGDLEHILAHTADLCPTLRGSRLFITGATGFFGKWLLESIIAANDTLDTGIRATLLSRDPAGFARQMPRLALRPEFEWLPGETENFAFPSGPFDYIIHLATPSAADLGAGDTARALAALQGMHRVLQFARHCGARRLLLASSGAVYGRQPEALGHIPEDYNGAPDPSQPMSAYGEIKRMSELMCALTPEVECVVARGFSFVGPYLPLSDKFAIGSFIRDAVGGGPIQIRGDGTPLRSYLYAADLAIWLVTLLVKGKPNRPYNVGSDQAIDLGSLARTIAAASDVTVEIGRLQTTGTTERYLPSIDRVRNELGLSVTVTLASALHRTIEWARQIPESKRQARM